MLIAICRHIRVCHVVAMATMKTSFCVILCPCVWLRAVYTRLVARFSYTGRWFVVGFLVFFCQHRTVWMSGQRCTKIRCILFQSPGVWLCPAYTHITALPISHTAYDCLCLLFISGLKPYGRQNHPNSWWFVFFCTVCCRGVTGMLWILHVRIQFHSIIGNLGL